MPLSKEKAQIYGIWNEMRQRCFNPRNRHYHNYGGRGITVCPRWDSLDAFREDMGERPPGMTLERINNDGNYEPGNCRWATRKEQQNNRRNNVRFTHDGRTQTLAQWAEEFGLTQNVLSKRLLRGWTPAEALALPASRNNPRKRRAS